MPSDRAEQDHASSAARSLDITRLSYATLERSVRTREMIRTGQYMGKGNYRSQRYLKINLQFSKTKENDTYNKCDVKCRIVSYKGKYYDSVPLQNSPREILF